MASNPNPNLWSLGWLLQKYNFWMGLGFQVWKFNLKMSPWEEKEMPPGCGPIFYHWLLRRLGKTHSTIYMIKKGWIENTVVTVIYGVLIWQKILKSIFRTLWEIGSLFASFLPGASFSIFLVHFLKPLLLRSLFKNRTEPHGVLDLIDQISDWNKFQICQISDWTYSNDKQNLINDIQLLIFFPSQKRCLNN